MKLIFDELRPEDPSPGLENIFAEYSRLPEAVEVFKKSTKTADRRVLPGLVAVRTT